MPAYCASWWSCIPLWLCLGGSRWPTMEPLCPAPASSSAPFAALPPPVRYTDVGNPRGLPAHGPAPREEAHDDAAADQISATEPTDKGVHPEARRGDADPYHQNCHPVS